MGMTVRSLETAQAFTTADGSTIRELLGLPTAPVRNMSLAEATLEPGHATVRHYHRAAEEFYYITHGRGWVEVDGAEREVAPGDAIMLAPGAWHQITALGDEPLRLLCCCAPAYRHDDTFFA